LAATDIVFVFLNTSILAQALFKIDEVAEKRKCVSASLLWVSKQK